MILWRLLDGLFLAGAEGLRRRDEEKMLPVPEKETLERAESGQRELFLISTE